MLMNHQIYKQIFGLILRLIHFTINLNKYFVIKVNNLNSCIEKSYNQTQRLL